MSPLLDVRNLRKSFAVSRSFLAPKRYVRAIDLVNLSVERGEAVGLIGESGCGKSTVARCIMGLIRPDAGEILLEGQSLSEARRRRNTRAHERLQMVFQDPYSSLNPRMSIEAILTEPYRIQGKLSVREMRERIVRLLEEVSLPSDSLSKYPQHFSGGQRQRISIARALALRPSLIVADEPLSALDVSVQAQIILLMKNLQKVHELGFLLISHDLGVVRSFCTRVAVMYLGRIVEEGTAQQVLDDPRHPYTVALREASLPPDISARDRLNKIQGEIPSALDPPLGCHFHPRCPQAMARCKSEVPSWSVLPDGRRVACHLYPQAAAPAATPSDKG